MARQRRRRLQPRTLNPTQRFELRIYQALGILPFRRTLFSLERILHWRDGQTNRNYHMRVVSPGGAAAFESYLLYHTLLHTVSLALLTAVFLEKAAYALPWDGMDMFALGMCGINVWCLMLQRYNQLRLRELRALAQQVGIRRLERRVERVLTALGTAGAYPEAREDLALVRTLLAGLSAGNIAYLGADDVPGLRRMAALLETAGSERRRMTPAPEDAPAARTIDRMARELASLAQPYSRTERRVDQLQRRLRPDRAPLLTLCAVVTEDGPVEEAFSELFRCSGPEKIWETLILLEAVLGRLPVGDVPT